MLSGMSQLALRLGEYIIYRTGVTWLNPLSFKELDSCLSITFLSTHEICVHKYEDEYTVNIDVNKSRIQM